MNETDSMLPDMVGWPLVARGSLGGSEQRTGPWRRCPARGCSSMSLRRRSSVACLAASGYCATRGPAAVAVGRVMASAIALPSALARQA
jgi:hypothetical protein